MLSQETVFCEASDFAFLSNQILSQGSSLCFRGRGWSMYPTIRDGDFVEVRPTSITDLGVGDVILCNRAGCVIVHRLVARWQRNGRGMLITKGDAVPHLDPPLSAGDVVGKVVAIERDGKRVDLEAFPTRWLNRLQGWLSYAEAVTWQWGRRVKRRLMKDKPSPLTPIAMRILRLPSRMCAALQNMAMR